MFHLAVQLGWTMMFLMMVSCFECLFLVNLAFLCPLIVADGLYEVEYLPNITQPRKGIYEHQVNMQISLFADVQDPWSVGPLIREECFDSGQVCK